MPAADQAPTRILFIEGNEDDTVGGSHHSMFDLVRLLDRTRFTPIVCFYRDNVFTGRLRSLGVEVLIVEDRRSEELAARRRSGRAGTLTSVIRGIVWRRRLLAEHGIQLVHINNTPLIGVDDWLPAAKLQRIPIISMARGHPVKTGWRVRRLSRGFDRVVAVSHYIAAKLAEDGIPPGRIVTVHNGIDLAGMKARVTIPRAATRAALGLADETVAVLMIGNIRQWKGQHVVLDAVAALAPSVRERLHVLFLGTQSDIDQAYRASLDAQVAAGGLSRHITFLGWRDDVANYIAAADVCLHASVIAEPFGRVVVEAMGLGVPMVASLLGGPSEVITESTGRLFDPADPAALARILTELVEQPALRATLGSAGERRAHDFGVDAMVAGVSAVYDTVLANHHRGA